MKKFLLISGIAILMTGVSPLEAKSPESEFSKVQAKLKAEAPEDFAKIEKLATTDLDAAITEMRKLAASKKIQLPAGKKTRNFSRRFERDSSFATQDGGRGGRRSGMRKGMQQRNSGNMLAVFVAESQIEAELPQKYKKIAGELLNIENQMRALAAKAHVSYPANTLSQLRILRSKAPEDFAAIVAKSNDSPRDAMRELFQLAAKHKIDLAIPFRNSGRAGMRPGMHRNQENMNGNQGMRRVVHPPLRKLRSTFPDEMKRYDSLRYSNPAEAAALLRELSNRLTTPDKAEK